MSLICWWCGCVPDYDSPYIDVLPCMRCGAPDTTYADRVGDTRNSRTMDWLCAPFYRLWPRRCVDCGKRFGHHDDCLPF